MNTHVLGTKMLVPFAIFAVAAVDERLQALRGEVESLTADRDSIINAADEAGVDLTDDQLADIERLTGEIEAKGKQIKAREAARVSAASAGRRAAPEPAASQATRGADGRPYAQPVAPRQMGARGGFQSFGEFAQAVRAGSRPGASLDQRLQAAATTYSSEGVGADGGFAVPQEFRTAIWQKVMGEDNLLTRCDMLVTGSNNLTVPKDETTPWDTTNGIQIYWDGEAATLTGSKVSLQSSTIRLNRLTALVPVTEELLEDAPGLDSYLRSKTPQKMQNKINTALVRGTGVGQPLGIMNAPSLVTVSKESGPQTADTIVFPNIVKMWSRMYAPCRRNAVWLINQDVEPQLNALAFLSSAASPVPAYLPANGLSASPYATLMGRPVVPVEACSTLGDVGDILLVDFSQYMALTKGTDVRVDVSMHLYFDQAVSAYRFIYRVAGQPWWGSAMDPQYGTNTRSWAVALETR